MFGDVIIQSPMLKKRLLLPEDGPLRLHESDSIVLHCDPIQMAFQEAYFVSFVVCLNCLCVCLSSFRGTSVDGADDALDHDGNMLLQPRNVFAELGLILTHGDSRNP